VEPAISPADEASTDGTSDRPEDGYRLLGARLQGLRKMRRLSLQEVADEVNVSRSFLSLVERGQTDLSLSRFSRLTEFYGVQPSELLVEIGSRFREPEIEDVADARMIDRGNGVEYRVLRADHPQIVIARLAPGARFEDLRAHQGEDFWVVQHGTVSLEYGGKGYALRQGQTVRFSGTLPHGFANPGNEPAELFALCSFPYW
jgi:transcriptional regulator with XRE-family HTH domain